MNEMNFSKAQADVVNDTSGYQEMMKQAFVQEFMNLLTGIVEDMNDIQAKELPKIKAAYAHVYENMDMSAKKASALGNEFYKKIENTLRAGIKVTGNDLGYYAGRVSNEQFVNKEVIVSDKQAKVNPLAKQVRTEFKKDVVRQADTKGLKNVPDKLQYWLQNFKEDLFTDNKKGRKRLVDDLIDGLAKNKGIMGVITDAIKLITLLGASWLRKFGTLGNVLSAALVLAGPSLAKLIGDVFLKGLGKFTGFLGKNVGKIFGFLGKGLLRAAPILGAAGAGYGAYDSFKKGDLVGTTSYTIGALAFALAPFLGPAAPIAMIVGGLATAIGAFHDKIGDWIENFCPWLSSQFELFKGWITGKVEEGAKGYTEGIQGKNSDKDASLTEKTMNSLGKNADVYSTSLDVGGTALTLTGMVPIGVPMMLAGNAMKKGKQAVNNITPSFLPEGSPLKTNQFGYVTNFGKLNRNKAWDAMMKWREQNPEEFNKRYEVIDANEYYTDSLGKKHKGSSLVKYGSFINDLSNKRGNETPSQIILGKGSIDRYMQDVIEYGQKYKVKNPFMYQQITSGIGTSTGHTVGGEWYQHDTPLGTVYDVSGGGADNFVEFMKKKYSKGSRKTFMHGDKKGGEKGWHGHVSIHPDYLQSMLDTSIKIPEEPPKKAEEKAPETLVGANEKLPEVPQIKNTGASPDNTMVKNAPYPIQSIDPPGNRVANVVLTGIGNMANIGVDATHMIV